jgi:molybdopterin converting factor small subunit
MAQVRFTRHLQRYFPPLGDRVQAQGETVAEVVRELDRHFPGLAGYIVDEQGALRRHVNIFLRRELVQDRQTLSDAVGPEDELYIFQALSGGSMIVTGEKQ